MSDVVLVTGASSGVGLSVAVQAAQSGYRVYATMRDLGKKQALQQAATAANVSMELLELDVSNPMQVEQVTRQIVADQGRIDCVVANAGVGYVRPTEHAPESEVARIMDTNFMGVFRCVKAALPHMRQQKSGRLIAVSSVGGLVGQPFNEIYCASKFAVEGFFESLASYMDPEFGIYFTLVEPGGIHSEFVKSILKGIEDTGGFEDDEYKPLIERYISGRSGRNLDGVMQSSDDVALVVLDCLRAKSPPVRVRTSPWSEEFSSIKTSADPDGKRLQASIHKLMLGAD